MLGNKIKQFAIFAIFSMIAANIFAIAPGAYVGVDFAQTDLNNLPFDVNSGTPQNAACFNSETDAEVRANCNIAPNVEPNNTGTGYKLYLGTAFSEYAAAEIGAAMYAPSQYEPQIAGYTHQPQTRTYSIDLMGKGMYPFMSLNLFGKAGLAVVYKSSSEALLLPEELDRSSIQARLKVAVGASYSITPKLAVNISGSRIFEGHNFEQADFYGIGFSYHFVSLYCGQFLC